MALSISSLVRWSNLGPSQYARPSCDSGGLMLPPPSPSPLKTVYAGAARPIPPLFNDSASSSSSFTVPPTPFNSLNEGSGLGSASNPFWDTN